ncbi:Type II secretory pathway component PulD [Sulfuriferula sp. AH1]|uniref:secretin and TonB N-terminal domain-containing protein n=1 Tax=Sulfuriferula sp. AH1 TaxID=1985873 RepID=UPI000B3B8A1F|nr:secretin and TonB N-terminal domain-containing protein [Sulfuriferula sp. AH1]ARU32579.1 Type II secretory pathway component PulD [Sulfuriferula sp. AH1]
MRSITTNAGWGVLLVSALSGCVPPNTIRQSAGHIQASAAPAPAETDIPPLVRTLPDLLRPKPQQYAPLYTVVVDNVPVKELLFSLARDTRYNIDISPGITGTVTLNAVNESLPAILERVARQANIRYKMEGKTLSIMPDTPYMQTYRINYVNLSRNTDSTIGVAAKIASTGGGVGKDGDQDGNSSATTVASKSNNNFWDVLTDNLRAILISTRLASQRQEDKQQRVDAERNVRSERLLQAQAVARAGAAAPGLYKEVFGSSLYSPQAEMLSKNDVVVNPVTGTVSVVGTERQQRLIQNYLSSVNQASQRQVLIEATIVEVTLKDQYKMGIDWQRVVESGGAGWFFSTNGAASTNLANTLTPFFSGGFKDQKYTATLNLLESFGNLRVLSSPKLMAINNQTALLKVVDNLVYFTVKADTVTSNNTAPVTTYTTTPQTVPVGLVMSLTPQISENGMVTLNVRPTISRKVGDVVDPNPSIIAPLTNKVPVIQVREMESVLQVGSGQTVILGGLMQDDTNRARDGIPGLSRQEGIGALFGQHERNVQQTELVIFLRPTVIATPSLESDELKSFKRYLPKPDQELGQLDSRNSSMPQP